MTEKEIIEILEKAKIKLATNKDLKILYHKLKNVLFERMDEKHEKLNEKMDEKYEKLDKKIDEKYEKLDKKIDQKFNTLIITIIIQTLAIIGTLIGIVLKVIQSMK